MVELGTLALAGQAATVLAPYLPHLAKAGEKIAEGAGQVLEEGGGQLAKALWEKLRPQVEAKPAAQEAAQDVAATPDDEEARITLKRQLSKLFEADPTLAREVAGLLQQAGAAGETINVTVGERGIGLGKVGGDASGTFITGDNNRISGTHDKPRRPRGD